MEKFLVFRSSQETYNLPVMVAFNRTQMVTYIFGLSEFAHPKKFIFLQSGVFWGSIFSEDCNFFIVRFK